MITVLLCYATYAILVTIFYKYARMAGDLKRFSAFLLICIPTDSVILSILFAGEMMAAYMDKENDMDVYDLFHIVPIAAIIGGIVYKVINGYEIQYIINIYNLIPIIFTLITIKARGLSDTFAMIAYSLYGIYAGVDTFYIILGFFIGHVLQFINQTIYCRKKSILFKDKPMMPFLPSLYIGFVIIIVITTYI